MNSHYLKSGVSKLQKEINNFWNEYFRLYDVLNVVHPYKNLLGSVLNEMELEPGKVVLDVGTGTGNLAYLISKTGSEVVGLDFSSVGLGFFKNKLPNAKAILHDLNEPIPLEDGQFDYLVCINTLFAIYPDRRNQIAKEFFRLLKSGGKIIISNLTDGYKPIRIYIEHIRDEIEDVGYLKAFFSLIKLIYPTIMLFYYNRKITNSNNGKDEIRLFKTNEQNELLKSVGFKNISDERRVFAEQAILTTAFKL